MNDNRNEWFGPHRRGFGWGPVAWQGWLITLVIVVGLIILLKCLLHH
jgi:hypothetical protein